MTTAILPSAASAIVSAATPYAASAAGTPEFARQMIAAYRAGQLPEVFGPYFAWKTCAAPLVSITASEAYAMMLACLDSGADARIDAYLARISYELEALRRVGAVKAC